MATNKIKFSGVIRKFTAKSGGEELVFGKVKSSDPKRLLELAGTKEKNKVRVEGSIEIIKKNLPGTE